MIDHPGENLSFIFSLPRSGSTLLSIILGNHPDLYCPPEPWLLLKLNELINKGNENAIFDDSLATLAINELVSTKEHMVAMRQYANSIYGEHLKKHQKKIFIDKTPRYYHIAEIIDLLFPKAKFFGLIRDPLDIAASYKETWKISIDNLVGEILSPNSFDFSIGLYKLSLFFHQLNNNKLIVKYEDLCNKPESLISEVCDFLQVKYLPQMLNYSSQSEVFSNFKSSKMGDKKVVGTDSIHAKAIGNWKRVLSVEDTQKLISFLGKEIFIKLGYSGTVDDLNEMGFHFPVEEEAQERRDKIAKKDLDLNSMNEIGNQNRDLIKYTDQLRELINNKDNALVYLSKQIELIKNKNNKNISSPISNITETDLSKNASPEIHPNSSYRYRQDPNFPLISIIVPSYNQGEYLRTNLENIFLQEYPNLEVIVMDGGSSDDSVSIIKEFQEKIYYWKSAPDGGQADAINTGMLISNGDLVTWLNSDDWYINDALWIIARSYKKFPQFGLFVGNGFREKEGILEPFCPRHIAVSQRVLLEGMDYILQPSTFISRKAWEKSGGLKTNFEYGFDWEFFIRILNDFPAVTINEFLSVSREHKTTKTSTGKMRRAEELIMIAQTHTKKEITLGSSYYLFETLLQLDENELPRTVRDSVYQGLLRIQVEMKNRWNTADTFPLLNDPKNVNFFQIPDSQNKINSKPTGKQNYPKISITIPSFNQAKYLTKAIRSIVDQNYPNLELFIYDGGSEDDSVKIIQEYQDFITDWSSAPDNGPADAINKGLLRSTGDILGWLNSDDLLADGSLWSIAKTFMSDPDAQVVFGNAVYIDESDGLFIADHGYQKTGFYYGKLQPLEKVPYYWQYVHSIPQPTVYFRRKLREKVGILNSEFQFIFDFEYFWRMRNVSEFKKIERTLAFYRIHAKSKTSSWENFQIELYKFSRPLWPTKTSINISFVLDEFVKNIMERFFGGYRRRLYPIKQLLKTIIKYQLGNPERLLGLFKKNKTQQNNNPPHLIKENREESKYVINTANRKYQFAYCGFFYPRHPGQSGGEIRDFHILRKLSELGEIDFFANSNSDQNNREDHLRSFLRTVHDPQILSSCLPDLIESDALKLRISSKVLRKFRTRNIPVLGALYHEDASKVAHLNEAYVKKGLHHVLKVNQPDFLVISPQLNPLPLQLHKAAYNTRIILSSYDVEKIRLERLTASQEHKLSKYAMRLETQRAKHFEEETLKIYDGIIAVSDLDKQKYIELYGFDSDRILVLENSVDTSYYSFSDRVASEHPEIVFTASMGYFPNDEASKRLIKQIMPIVRRKYPTARLWIVGQCPSIDLINLSDNVLNIVTGSVPDIRPYMDNATVTCIPLQTGSGTKYKILEAASLGVPIVCTSLSLEGLNLNGKDHVISGETDLELAEGIINVIGNPTSRISATQKASELIQREYSWNTNLAKIEPYLVKLKSLPIR